MRSTIFGNDGTLVESESLSADVITGIMADHGSAITYEDAIGRYRWTKLTDFAASAT